jgi:hypothetical protein
MLGCCVVAAGWGCAETGPAPGLTLRMLHRNDVLVLEADASPQTADITCTGAIPSRAVGTLRDSIVVQHRDTAVTYAAVCTARADGAGTENSVRYVLYGPDTRGAWAQEGSTDGYARVLTIGDEDDPSRNVEVRTNVRFGTQTRLEAWTITHVTADSVRAFHAASGQAFEGTLSAEYRVWTGHAGVGTGTQLTEPRVYRRD